VHHDAEIEIPASIAATLGQPKTPSAPKPAVGKQTAAPKGGKLKEPMVVLTLMKNEGPGGDRPEFVGGGQGKGMLIPRGTPSKVPYRYFETLKNAKKSVYAPPRDGAGNITNGDPLETVVHAFNFQVNQMPPRAQLLAWLEAQGGRWEPEIDEFYSQTFQPDDDEAAA
jgi:hypothetical protein